jgi:hypothetical protein
VVPYLHGSCAWPLGSDIRNERLGCKPSPCVNTPCCAHPGSQMEYAYTYDSHCHCSVLCTSSTDKGNMCTPDHAVPSAGRWHNQTCNQLAGGTWLARAWCLAEGLPDFWAVRTIANPRAATSHTILAACKFHCTAAGELRLPLSSQTPAATTLPVPGTAGSAHTCTQSPADCQWHSLSDHCQLVFLHNQQTAHTGQHMLCTRNLIQSKGQYLAAM